MRKARFTEEQMVKIIWEADKAPVAEVAKKLVADRDLELDVMREISQSCPSAVAP